MKKGLVNIAQGTPETLSDLKIFMEESKKRYSEEKIKTLESGVKFAIKQAKRVPDLEKEIKILHETIVGNRLDETNYLKEINELKMKLEDCEKLIIEDRETRG